MAVAMALVGSLSLPAVLASAGPMFEQSASDQIAQDVVGRLDPGPAGIYVSALGSSRSDLLDPFAQVVDERLAGIDALAPSVRTMISEELPIVVEGQSAPTGRAPEGRLFSRPGAVDALDVVAGSRLSSGAWITETLADELGVLPGDSLRVAGAEEPVVVAGIYRDLWSGELDLYWEDVPAEFIPRYLRVFRSPEFELVVIDDALMSRLGPGVRVVWQAPLASVPPTWEASLALAGSYRRLEFDLAGERALGDLYRTFATDPQGPPSFFTALYDAHADARSIISALSRPISTATVAGIAVGLALSTLGAVFLIRRRRSEYRLLAADGDGRSRFFVRAIVQYLAPAAAGVLLGVALAWGTIAWLGPSGSADLSAVPWTDVLVLSAAACLLAGMVTALLAVRLVDGMNEDVGTISSSWLFMLGGVTAAMWLQAGRAQPDDAGPLTIAFPFVGIVTGVVAMLVTLRIVLRAVRRSGARLPTSLFLAWRAVTGSETGALLLTGALGLAAGLAVLSSVFVASVDTAITDKATTIVGSDTRLNIANRAEQADLPEGTTILRTRASRVGEEPVELILVDPATFESSVRWPSSFGSSPADVVDALDEPVNDAVAAIVVGADRLPSRGQFGFQRVFPYEVVGELRSFPLASQFNPTLVMRVDQFERFARERFEQGLEVTDPADQLAAEALDEPLEFESPVEEFGHTLVSRSSPSELEPLAAAAGLVLRETLTIGEESTRVDNQSIRWAFDYLRILAVIGAVTSLGAMGLYLSERRRERAISAAMVEQMGVPRRTNLTAAVAEMVGLVLVALTTGAVSALLVAGRVFRAFEPNPSIPPVTEVVIPVLEVLTIVAVALGAVALTAGWVQHAATSAARARVFRG